MAQQKLRQGPGIGRDVECFVLANTRVRASRHVAHRIAAGLAGGDTGGRETAHQARRVVDVNVVELKILPRGHVRDAVGVLLGQLRHRLELIRVEPSARNLDPLHARSIPHRVRTFGEVAGRIRNLLNLRAVVPLAVVVALAVGSPAQPRFGEEALVHLALLAQGDFRFEDIQLAGQIFRHLPREFFLPLRVGDFHGRFRLPE